MRSFVARRHGRLRLLTGVGMVTILAASLMLVSSSGATPTAQAAAKHHRRHRRVAHRQALQGPISKSKVKVIRITIRGGKGGAIAAGDDYPVSLRNAPQDSRVDPWGEYNRECTSFVAWALYSRNGFTMPFHDNAIMWGSDAQRRGYLVNGSPAVGSVAWSNAGKWGHVAYVVAVNGSMITIEEYNEHFNGTYDQRTVPASTFTGYIHFKDPSVTLVQSQAPTQPQPTPGQTVTQTQTVTTGTTTTTQGSTPPPPQQTWNETAGGVAHTWTNYTNAGGTQGPSIGGGQTVAIACKITGFKVADGNTWWYRIASAPWSDAYYVSADAFYNNGQTSGSLVGTPFVDPAVANC